MRFCRGLAQACGKEAQLAVQACQLAGSCSSSQRVSM